MSVKRCGGGGWRLTWRRAPGGRCDQVAVGGSRLPAVLSPTVHSRLLAFMSLLKRSLVSRCTASARKVPPRKGAPAQAAEMPDRRS